MEDTHLLNPGSGQFLSEKQSRASGNEHTLWSQQDPSSNPGPATSHLCTGDWLLALPGGSSPQGLS